MAKQIVAAVRLKRKVLEGTDMQLDIVDYLLDATRKILFAAPDVNTTRIKRDLVEKMKRIYFPEAVRSGRKSAIPLLDEAGGQSAIDKASVLSGTPKRVLSQYTRDNLKWFSDMTGVGTEALSSDLKAELSRAARDGVSKRRMITQWTKANKAELREIKRKRKILKQANIDVANAEATGDKKVVRAAKDAARKARNNARRTTTAMGRVESQVQGAARDAVRREAQQAQFASYKQAGYTTFTWITVGGSLSCPDCDALHNTTKGLQQWHGMMPGDGHTVCDNSCICELVPNEAVSGDKEISGPVNPYLKEQLES